MFSKNLKLKLNIKFQSLRGIKVMKHLGLLLVLMLMVSCTKEKAFEFVPDKKVVSKGMFEKEDYNGLTGEEISKLTPEEKKKFRVPRIAVMSYGQATRTASASMPYFQGRTKLVEFEVSEKRIEVRELEKDPRFSDNPTNSKTIMVLPVRHVEYECQKDAYGECQNKEVESNKKPWNERPFMEVDFEGSKILDADELPVEITNLISGCYTTGDQKLINYELDKDVFNYEIQRSYSLNLANPACWGEISDFENLFENLNFDIRYVYSMVRADKIASKDYQPIQYRREDEGTFGFFNTKLAKLDVDNNSVEDTDDVFLNRWNPAKKVIQYHLSDEFNTAEYGYILEATRTAVQSINNGLAEAGAGIQIQLMPPSGKKVGDLRNNMIVMVDDPLASRIIGYGPSAAHPLTGEIVNARVVMYLGTIKGIVKKTYEDMREELLAQKEETEKAQGAVGSVAGVVASLKERMNIITDGHNRLADRGTLLRDSPIQNSVSRMNLSGKSDLLKARANMATRSLSSAAGVPAGKLAQIKKDISSFRKLEGASLFAKSSKFINKRIDVLSKHNIYPEELFNAEYAIRAAGVDQKLEETLKPWNELSSQEKEEIIRAVLPHIWIPTLVHEFGHNLGLRHNFAGSEDKANFYSHEELGKMGIEHDIPYASMMEYSYKSTNELPTLGKYDIAALKFGYKREVEVVGKDGAVASVVVANNLEDTTKVLASQGLALKEYRYCTDEHVSANPTCNRFDEGTNLVEIATHFITSYEDNYKRINRRNSRKNFSVMNEGGYLQRTAGTFYDLRLMFELYERIKNDYGIADNSELWTSVDFLKEIKEASTLGGQFLLSILLTPDVQCAISLADVPESPIAMLPIRNLDPYATNCYHPDVARSLASIGEQNNLNLIISGEGGKSFKSRKDPSNPNAYADQIDVQGIWIDKMLAMQFLFARELGSSLFDGNTQNYLSHANVGPNIENVLAAILLGAGGVEVPFHNKEGYPVKFAGENGEATSLLPVSIEFGAEHNIDVPAAGGLAEYFGLPSTQTTFLREISSTLARLIPTNVGSAEASKFMDSFSVYREWPGGENAKNAKQIKADDKTSQPVYVAEVGNQQYFALASNKVAKNAIERLAFAKVLDQVTTAEVKKLIEMKKAGEKLPENAPDRIKAAFALDVSVLEASQNGLIKSQSFYEELLGSLVVAVR